MSFAAKLHWSSPERRGQSRYKFAVGSVLQEADGTAIDVEVENISVTGLGLRSPQELPIGSRGWLGIPGLGHQEIEIVRRDGDFYGCRLDTPLKFDNAEYDTNNVVFGHFTPRPEAFLHDFGLADVEIEKWPRRVSLAVLVGTPLAVWTAVIGIRLFVW